MSLSTIVFLVIGAIFLIGVSRHPKSVADQRESSEPSSTTEATTDEIQEERQCDNDVSVTGTPDQCGAIANAYEMMDENGYAGSVNATILSIAYYRNQVAANN